jgi:hypothetical protein
LFSAENFQQPLARSEARLYELPLEMVRQAPSASNKQPWRVLKAGNTFHFYLQRTLGYREGFLVRKFTVCDMQRLDMGIAMCHFELTCRERGLSGNWLQQDSAIPAPTEQTEYLVSWVSKPNG